MSTRNQKVIKKKIKLTVNDLFDELREENDRLLSQLIDAEKCIKLLDKYRNYLNTVCKCNENIENQLTLNDLENQYKSLPIHKNQFKTELSQQVIDINLNQDISLEVEVNSIQELPETKPNNSVKDFNYYSTLKKNNLKQKENNNKNSVELSFNLVDDKHKCDSNTTVPKVVKKRKKTWDNRPISSREDFIKVQHLSQNDLVLGKISLL